VPPVWPQGYVEGHQMRNECVFASTEPVSTCCVPAMRSARDTVAMALTQYRSERRARVSRLSNSDPTSLKSYEAYPFLDTPRLCSLRLTGRVSARPDFLNQVSTREKEMRHEHQEKLGKDLG
jgi:hypothetical protein